MDAPPYTTEKPTEPGLYYMRWQMPRSESWNDELVLLRPTDRDQTTCMFLTTGDSYWLDKLDNCWWSGPIRPPAAPHISPQARLAYIKSELPVTREAGTKWLIERVEWLEYCLDRARVPPQDQGINIWTGDRARAHNAEIDFALSTTQEVHPDA